MTRFMIAAMSMVALSSPAIAQVAGTYSGTTADGNGVSFTVSVDDNNKLAVTGDSVNFTEACKGGGTLNGGWGFGTDSVIANGKATGNLEFPYATIIWKLDFSSNNQSATGTVSSIGATLTPVGAKPKKAQICKSPNQAMTLTLQANAARVPAPRAGVVTYLGGNLR